MILLDVFFTGGEAADHLETVEFFELCRSKLRDGGVVAANLVDSDPLHKELAAALQSCFNHCVSWTFVGTAMVFAIQHKVDLEIIKQ